MLFEAHLLCLLFIICYYAQIEKINSYYEEDQAYFLRIIQRERRGNIFRYDYTVKVARRREQIVLFTQPPKLMCFGYLQVVKQPIWQLHNVKIGAVRLN